MKSIEKALRLTLLTALMLPAAQAMANQSETRCRFGPNELATNDLLKVHIRDMGTLYVPKDARVGTVIGPADIFQDTFDLNNLVVSCYAYGERMHFNMNAIRGVHPPLPPIRGVDRNGHVLKTNIPGIGAIITMGRPFWGGWDQWTPIGANPPLVPFRAWYEQVGLNGVHIWTFGNRVTLVKTGDLAPGIHQLDGPLVSGHLEYKDFGKVLEFTLRATIIQTQCEVLSDAVSANPVKLGEWSVKDFTGPGFTTPETPFQIRLSACQVDPDPDNQTLATIELDGRDGSQPIGPAGEHVFSLTNDSEASGIGIQMLYDDQPMPLNREIGLVTLQDGSVPLNFKARFYQVEPSNALRAGVAKGALNFTIRYR